MSHSSPIVLLTDFGTRDAYVGSMKGVILSINPEATIVDLTHEIEPQNLVHGALVLEAAWPYFPQGSIFTVVIDPGVGSERQILAAKTPKGIFLAPDNGVLGPVLEKEKDYELWHVTNQRFFRKDISATFHGRDCFAPTAAHLAKDPGRLSELGSRVKGYRRLEIPKPKVMKTAVEGEIVLIDHFGNAMTNISRCMLKKTGLLKGSRVFVGKKDIGPIRRSYFEVGPGEPLALFNSTDGLEIAVNQGSATKRLKLHRGGKVVVILR